MRQPATYEDLLKVPEHFVAEIVEGELFTSPRPAMRHVNAFSELLTQLRNLFNNEVGGWWIVTEPELHLAGDVLVPDIAGWRRQRMPAIPDTAFVDLAPDWVCEVLSRSNAAHDRYRKMPRYAAHKFEYAWIVDTMAKGVEVYQRQGLGWYQVAIHQGTGTVRAVPFEAGEINLARLWID